MEDISSIRKKSPSELRDLLVKCRRDVVDASFQKKVGRLSGSGGISDLKQKIAMIMTVINERKIGGGDA